MIKGKVFVFTVAMFLVLFSMFSCGGDKEETSFIHDNETISVATTWSGIHIIKGTLSVNAALTIKPCTVIQMDPDAKITVFDDGAFKSIGTEKCPILITSSKVAKGAGDWELIEIFNTASADNELTWNIIEFGGNDYGVLWVGVDASVKVTNTVFKNILKSAVVFDNNSEIKGFTGNSFIAIGEYLIDIYPDNVRKLDAIVSDTTLKSEVYVHDGTIISAGTWKNISVPYVIDTLNVNESLTVMDGTVIKVNPDMNIAIFDNGELILKGTAANHITIKSSKTIPAPGDWERIEIFNTSSNGSKFTYTDIMHGGGGDYGQLWIGIDSKIALNNVVFSQGKTCDITNENEDQEFVGSEYTVCVVE